MMQMQDMLMTHCLTLLPNSHKDVLSSGFVTTVTHITSSERECIHAHADKKLGLADIAAAVGCSDRGGSAISDIEKKMGGTRMGNSPRLSA